ncbi:acetyl-coenzyme A thioesterase-like [Melozone crissalis]|uniref:acetyl-coenzyme A thioesterase-like n=1 Tax=Melozone crissalis TaxID=40204 RepID=UPI0023DC4D4E|nr:acetyl-coenzyme A thioesterase-like [Melozone crissalis]
MQRLRVPGARSVAALVPSRLRRTGSLPPVRRVRSDPLLTGAAARRRGAPAARAGSLPRLRRWAWKSALCVYRKVLAADTDGHGELDSGTLLRWMEQVAWLAAEKHAGVPCTTESMNEIVFGDTARVGEILAIRAKVNIQVKARIEVGIEVTVEDVVTKYEKIVTMAYATYEAKPAGAEKIEPKPIELRSEEDYLEYFLSLDRSIFRRDYSKVLQKVMQESSKEDLSKDEQAISTEHTYVQSMELVLPSHTTQQGNTSAGQIMDWIQMVASISASRLCRSQPFLKEISRFTFWRQSVEYDRLLFKASVNNTFKSSVEVGVRVEAFSAEEWAQERPEPQRICSAFLTFSALDEKGEPFTFPRVRPATRDDERRFYEAAVRKRFLFSSMSIVYARAEEPSDMWEERNKAYLNYKNIAALTYVAEKTKWKIALDNSEDNIKVFTDEEGDIRLMKVEMEVNVPFHMAAFLLLDFNHRPTWDKHILACKVVEDVSQSEKIYHLTSGPTAGRQPKDFVVLVSLREPLQADLPYIVAVKSVTHKAMPARLGYNRAQDVCSGFQIHRTGICSCTTSKTHP